MADKTKIEWADATVNFWIGCTEVSPACDLCYARDQSERYGWAKWGSGEPRYRTKTAKNTAFRLERKALREGRRFRVFTNSMSDFFDNEVPDAWRDEAFDVIDVTPHLDWMVLTKRPQVARKYLANRRVRENIWLGTTVENQGMADVRVPILLETPAAVRFLSCEPLLGPIDLRRAHMSPVQLPRVDWVIAGGESGQGARPTHPDWFRSLRDQCAEAGVPYFHKQNGEWVSVSEVEGEGRHYAFTDGATVRRVGKKAAGHLLDGREHREYPQ